MILDCKDCELLHHHWSVPVFAVFCLDLECVCARVFVCVRACQVQVTSLCAAGLFFWRRRRKNQTKLMHSFKCVFLVSSRSPSHCRCAPHEKVLLTSIFFSHIFSRLKKPRLVSSVIKHVSITVEPRCLWLYICHVTEDRYDTNHLHITSSSALTCSACAGAPPVDLPPHCVKVSAVLSCSFSELY